MTGPCGPVGTLSLYEKDGNRSLAAAERRRHTFDKVGGCVPIFPQNKAKGVKTMAIERKEVKEVIQAAIHDSRSKDGTRGVEHFVDEMIQLVGPDVLNTHKLAWTKLTELLVILDKSGAKVLDPRDVLNIMAYLITSSVCIKDSTSVTQ